MSLFVHPTEVLLFTRHLAILIRAGVPIGEGLEILESNTRNSFFRKYIADIRHGVEAGSSLYKSIAKHPELFSHVYREIVRVGEESGTLDKSLNHLGEQMQKEYAFRRQVQTALLYPSLVVTAVFLVGGGISWFVLPRLVGIFRTFDAELPAATRFLIWFADTLQRYGILIFGGCIGLLALLFFLYRWRPTKTIFDWLLLRIPVVGKMLKTAELGTFARNLGVMLQSGVPINQALNSVTRSVNNEQYRRVLQDAADQVSRGSSLGKAFADAKTYFPDFVRKLLGVGEKAGTLDESLIYISEFYEEDLNHAAKNLTTLLEPMLLLVLGGVVVFIALAILAPIYGITQSI